MNISIIKPHITPRQFKKKVERYLKELGLYDYMSFQVEISEWDYQHRRDLEEEPRIEYSCAAVGKYRGVEIIACSGTYNHWDEALNYFYYILLTKKEKIDAEVQLSDSIQLD
jgi:hypothetical protein